ncbi:MAG: AAA family ATPase [Actinobacteria bacterium]|nr:AAA family ATPase [Actinomycetota bacterium]
MERIETGVPELDLVLDGGFPLGSLVVFAGGPGTGKTILAQQICFSAATPEHKAIYYTTLAEPHNKLVRYIRGFDFFDEDALEERVEFINLGDLLLEDGSREREPLGPMISEIVRACFEREPSVVVIDSAKALRDFVDQTALRKVLHDLTGKVAHSNTVVLFLGEYADEEIEGSPEFSLTDGIVQFAYEAREPVDRRWLRVRKLRGANHLAGKHSFEIGQAGITVYPRLETVAIVRGDGPTGGERISSGIVKLDELMGGGTQAGDATAIQGPSGSGKTIACLHFVVQGLEQGERCLYVSFQETPSQLEEKAASFGWDLAAAREAGQLAIHHVPPGELDLDTIGAAVRAQLADGSLRRIAIDSLGELVFASREIERFPAFARALIGSIRARGASSLITSETTTLGPTPEPLAHLSFLFHNVILLRYIEIESEIRRAVSVLKMRDSDHARGVWAYEIDEHGIVIADEQLGGLTGLLGWTVLRDTPPTGTS